MIEQMTGKSISELFDWVVGTSTGGILALAMIYGESGTCSGLYAAASVCIADYNVGLVMQGCDTWVHTWLFNTHSKHAIVSLLCKMLGGLSLADLRRLYFNMKDTVFKQQSMIVNCICDTSALERLLQETLGEWTTPSESQSEPTLYYYS